MNSETRIPPEPSVKTASSSHPGLAPPGKKRILLADDSPQIRESLSKVLRNAGYHVTPVAQGGQALDRALEDEFDLLLMDLNMPGMDGWETLDHLARLKPALPVIIITAQPNQRDWAEAEGARALMEKPLEFPRLLQTIRDFTTQPAAPRAAERAAAPLPFRLAAAERPEFRSSDFHRRWRTG